MIQRIQSIFLLLAAVSFGLPIWNIFNMLTSSPSLIGELADGNLALQENVWMLSGAIASSFIALVAIFLYTNRKMQINLSALAFLLHLILVVGCIIFILFQNQLLLQWKPNTGMYLSLFGLLSLMLAIRNIRKDEDLVKSMDRLR